MSQGAAQPMAGAGDQQGLRWRARDHVLDAGGRALVMGIVNVTPDSFSDGGRFAEPGAAIDHGLALVSQGADILDVGGESTRPGAAPVPAEEELRRVLPVVRGLVSRAGVPVSVDTSKVLVAEACLQEGAQIINDVTALGDARMAELVARFGAGLVLVHVKGTPATMQDDPRYDDVVGEVRRFLGARLEAATAAGIDPECVAVDPGIGFGKTAEHNRALIARLRQLAALGRPVCLGVSRKRVVGGLLKGRPVEKRLAGSLAVLAFGLCHGAVQVMRVHDVEETRDLADIFEALGRQAPATAPRGRG